VKSLLQFAGFISLILAVTGINKWQIESYGYINNDKMQIVISEEIKKQLAPIKIKLDSVDENSEEANSNIKELNRHFINYLRNSNG